MHPLSRSSESALWLRGDLVLNWRLMAVPSFLLIPISFSCRLANVHSSVVVQQCARVLIVLGPPFKLCHWCPEVEGIKMTTSGTRAWRNTETCVALQMTLADFLRTRWLTPSEDRDGLFLISGPTPWKSSYCNSSAHFAVLLSFSREGRRVQLELTDVRIKIASGQIQSCTIKIHMRKM